MARQIFTARAGGVSRGKFAALNLATHVGDDESDVLRNRADLAASLNLDDLVFMNQTHGNKVFRVMKTNSVIPEADALVTTEKSLGLAVMVADCLPILVDGESVVAAIHAGRRGVMNGVIGKTIGMMVAQGAQKMRASIGPAICGKCYEVDEPTYREMIKIFPEGDAGLRHIDIRKIAIKQLNDLGCAVENFEICTKENPEYFSYRRDGQTGRQVGVITL
jgi:polyphenol oxidase